MHESRLRTEGATPVRAAMGALVDYQDRIGEHSASAMVAMDLALLHSAERGAGDAVGVAGVDRAISQVEAIRGEGAGAPPTAEQAAFMAESMWRRIKTGRLPGGFTMRTARRYGVAAGRSSQRVKAAIDVLIDRGGLLGVDEERSVTIYRINQTTQGE